jgi:anaerobic selenocysteine-containing dehydrogenase
VGPKGEGRFERISWDAALDEIANRFRSIDEYGGQAILPYSYPGTEGILNGLTRSIKERRSWSSTRSATGRRRAPTGTSPSGRGPTEPSRWR